MNCNLLTEVVFRSNGLFARHGSKVRGLSVAIFVSASGLAIGAQTLPDAPSALIAHAFSAGGADAGSGDANHTADVGGYLPNADRVHRPPCTDAQLAQHRAYLLSGLPNQPAPPPGTSAPTDPDCRDISKLYIVADSKSATPLTSKDKGRLAVRDVVDPFNLLFVAGYSSIAIAANAHSAYGPGFKGFGKLFGYSMLLNAQGEFFGTYLIPSIVHQDPRYHRMRDASVSRRVLHALAHTVVTSHDDGAAMPNYATLLTYPISAELANLYVPGIQTDGASTARRIAIGLATDPAGSLVAEFLPDIAKRIRIRVVFVQEILNQVIVGAPNTL